MKLLKISNIFWVCILIILIVFSISFSFISADAPYYLTVARDISNGLIPYKDIYSIYTPAMMYLNALLFDIFKEPEYYNFLSFQYVIILVSSLFLYAICRKYDLSKTFSIYLALFLFIAVLSSDGTYINLEVYVLLFSLIAYWFLMKGLFFWTGVFLALCFFSKQYGILNFIPYLLLGIVHHGYDKKNLVGLVIGATFPLLAFLLYFLVLKDIPLYHLLEQLTGKGYGQKGVSSTKSLFSILVGFKVFLLLIIPLFSLKINPFKSKIDGILISGILLNLIPIIIQNYPHYFILTYPFIFILIARNYSKFNLKVLIVSNLVLAVISVLLFLRIYRYKNINEEQQEIAEYYLEHYPETSEVFLLGKIRFLYLLNNYHNPVLKEVGYSYDFIPDDDFKIKYPVLSLDH
jgi:hypothetical protein